MIGFLQQMGIFLVPLLALSIYGVGLILAKRQQWKRCIPLSSAEFAPILNAVSLGEISEVKMPASHPVAQLLANAHEPALMRQVRAQGMLQTLEERLGYFPALANLSTLSGLFGTVCGMIVSFLALRSGGGADPSALAGGIAQALVATAMGLVTAIPALAAHAVFQRRLLSLTGQLEAVLAAMAQSPGEKGRA